VIYTIYLSEIIAAMLAFFDGRQIFLLSLRNYYQMEGINHKSNFFIKAGEASHYVKFRDFCCMAVKAV